MFSYNLLIVFLILLGIAWNLLLAVIPCLLAYEIPVWLKGRRWGGLGHKDRFVLTAAFLLWLFFFPNTAYLFTVVRYLVNYCTDYNIHWVCTEEIWKAPVVFLYACSGLPAFTYSLRKMTLITRNWLPVAIIPITALGILFGLWERANTWDIVAHPLLLLQKTAAYFLEPIALFNWLAFTAVLIVIYYGTLYLWSKRQK